MIVCKNINKKMFLFNFSSTFGSAVGWKFTMPYDTKLNAVYVYNRWGALIYSIDEIVLNADNSKIKVVRWDGHTTSGEECTDGIYFYIVSFTENGEKKTFKVNVTLIR